jgi:hypothetical protein
MKAKTLSKLVRKAYEKETEERTWELWLTFDGEQKKKQPFNTFLEHLKRTEPNPKKDIRTDKEILNDADKIINMMKHSK